MANHGFSHPKHPRNSSDFIPNPNLNEVVAHKITNSYHSRPAGKEIVIRNGAKEETQQGPETTREFNKFDTWGSHTATCRLGVPQWCPVVPKRCPHLQMSCTNEANLDGPGDTNAFRSIPVNRPPVPPKRSRRQWPKPSVSCCKPSHYLLLMFENLDTFST